MRPVPVYRVLSLCLLLALLQGTALAQNYLEMGIHERDPQKRLEYLNKAVTQNPSDVAYLLRGETHLNAGNFSLAINDFKAAKTARKDDKLEIPPYLLDDYLARCYYQIGNSEDCITHANATLKIKADNPVALEVRGLSYLNLKSYDLALQDFVRLAGLVSDQPYPNFYQAVTLYNQEKYSDALRQIDVAIQKEPGNPRFKERKGMILMMMGKQDEAENLLLNPEEKTTKASETEKAQALAVLGQQFARNGDYKTAASYYERSINLHKDMEKRDGDYRRKQKDNYAEVYILLGDAYQYGLDDPKKALESYYSSVQIRDNDYRVWLKIGDLQSFQRNFDYAIAAFERCFALEPNLTEGWVNYGYCYGELKQRDKAIEVYSRALRIPNVSSRGLLLNNRGFSYLEIGQLDKCKKDLEDAIAEDPGIAMSHISLGEYFIETKEYDRAIEKFDYALSMEYRSDRETLVGYFKRGLAKLRKGDRDGAVLDLQKAVRLKMDRPDPIQVEATETLGIAYYEQEDWCNARQTLIRAMEMDRATPPYNSAKESPLYLQKVSNRIKTPCP